MNKLTMTQNDLKELANENLFTPDEWKLRKDCISMLRTFQSASIAAGKALSVIKEKKLYRPHASLKEFCERECGWTKQRAYQLIAAVKIVEALPEKSQQLLTSEGAIREIAKVPENKRVEVLTDAKQNTLGSEKVTAKSIRSAAERNGASSDAGQKPTNGKVDVDALGLPIPPKAQPYWDRIEHAKSILGAIQLTKTRVNALLRDDPMWCEVNLNGVLGDLSNAFNRFKAAVPAYVCPYCQGSNPSKCTACKSRGVISKHMWDVAVPVEMKRMRERAVKK